MIAYCHFVYVCAVVVNIVSVFQGRCISEFNTTKKQFVKELQNNINRNKYVFHNH